MSLYIVLAAINLAFWVAGMSTHVGLAVHLFPLLSAGLFAVDHVERKNPIPEHAASTRLRMLRVEPIGHNPLVIQPLLSFGSTIRRQIFVPEHPLEQESARLLIRSRFQHQSATRQSRTRLLESHPSSTAQLAT